MPSEYHIPRLKSLNSQLEEAQKNLIIVQQEKDDYLNTLLSDPEAQKRRIVLVSEGKFETSEYTQEQLQRVKQVERNFTNARYSVDRLERDIEDEHKAEAERQAIAEARASVEPSIELFNNLVEQLRELKENILTASREHGFTVERYLSDVKENQL